MSLTPAQLGARRGERGSVTVMTAVLMVGLVLVIGLCIDVSRIYMLRAGLQNAADAAALAAARELNSGSQGLTDAVTQAKSVNLTNKYGLSRSGITVPAVTIAKVEFSNSLASNATWYDNTNGNNVPANVVASIRFVRVTTQPATLTMLFAAKDLGSTKSVQAIATAGMSPGLNTICDYVPLAVAKPTPTTPFASGTELMLQFVPAGTTNLVNQNAIVLQTDNSNSATNTRDAAAGILSVCTTIGTSINTSNSQSAEGNNGPYQIEDGLNTRLDTYPNGNQLPPSQAPPDPNVYESATFSGFNWANYKSASPTMTPTHSPSDNRRIIVMPLVDIGPISGSVVVKGFGAFLFLRKVDNPKQPSKCNDIPNPCGHVYVESIGDGFTVGAGSYDPTGACTNLTKAVLYK